MEKQHHFLALCRVLSFETALMVHIVSCWGVSHVILDVKYDTYSSMFSVCVTTLMIQDKSLIQH